MQDTGIVVVGKDGKQYSLVGNPVGTGPTNVMPVGDLPGWKQIFTEDFSTDALLGQFVQRYGAKWEPYPDGWQQTHGFSNPARYNTTLTCSVKDGVLNQKLHRASFPDAQGNLGPWWMSAALQPKVNGVVHTQTYGKYTIRFRSEPLVTYKTAWLLWPKSGNWPTDGEIDFPEGGLDSVIQAYMHRQNGTSGGDQDAYTTNVTYKDWHIADIEWSPTECKFTLDGVVIGRSTSRIPNTPMRWVIQTEGCWGGTPPIGASANLQIDWAVMYSRIP